MDELVVKRNPYLEQMLSERWLIRRAQFILQETQIKDGAHDQVIGNAIYVISDFATIGERGGSRRIKQINRRMSEEAYRLLQGSPNLKSWIDQIENEHPWPKMAMWKEIQKHGNFKGPKWVLKLISQVPSVSVTKREARALGKKPWKSEGSPKERYQVNGIKFHYADQQPKSLFGKN